MSSDNKLCFVIMGYGLKADYATNRTLDLDKTYKNIIKPAVEQAGLRCIRGDEILDSGMIDKSMYAILMHADLVIADISTYNPNALYELGVRHAVRPFSTIILKESSCILPFDISHNRIFSYKHLGEDIGSDEANRCQTQLKILIDEVIRTKEVDSPLYELLRCTTPPLLDLHEYESVIDKMVDKDKTVFSFVEKAKQYMSTSGEENNEFAKAASLWKKAEQLVPTEIYFTQQRALCTYKSKQPSKHSALCDGLTIIDKLNPCDSNDNETLGIAGAICRRLYQESRDIVYLDRAITHYGRGYELNSDYYTGENFAFCLDIKRIGTMDDEEKVYYKVKAKKTREKNIVFLEALISYDDFQRREDKKWIYASLSNCYYALNCDDKGKIYESKFENEVVTNWEKETFKSSKQQILSLRNE